MISKAQLLLYPAHLGGNEGIWPTQLHDFLLLHVLEVSPARQGFSPMWNHDVPVAAEVQGGYTR